MCFTRFIFLCRTFYYSILLICVTPLHIFLSQSVQYLLIYIQFTTPAHQKIHPFREEESLFHQHSFHCFSFISFNFSCINIYYVAFRVVMSDHNVPGNTTIMYVTVYVSSLFYFKANSLLQTIIN